MQYKSNYYRTLVYAVIFAGVVILPFVWWPAATIAYELPRVWFFCRFVEILAVLSLVFQKQMPENRLDMKLVFVLASFFGLAVLASILGVDLTKSVAGNYWRGDGLVTFGHLVGFGLILALWWRKSLEKVIIWALSVSVVVIAVWAFVMSARNGFFIEGISFGQPNFLAGWLFIAGTVVVSYFKQLKMRLFVLLCVFLGLAVTRSWATLMLFGLYVAYLFPKIRILAAVVVFVGAVWWVKRTETFSWLGPNGVVYEGRERIFRKVWGGVLQRPILGWGWSNVDYAFESYDWPFPVTNDVYVDKAHSSLFEVTATMGLVGLVAYILFMGRAGYNLRKSTWLIPLVFFILHSQTNIVGIGEETLFWLMLGSALVVTKNNNLL